MDRRADDITSRRRRAVVAGYRHDVARARELLGDPDPRVRVTALGALARAEALDTSILAGSVADPEASVRRRACQEAGRQLATKAAAGQGDGAELVALLLGALDDPEPWVVEMAAWALGEGGERATAALARLSALCRHHDPVCRESAVAALGAIGGPAGLDAVLGALDDRPPIRRRAVLALSAFEDPRAETGLRRAAADRDWQVRQAAEELLDEQ